MEETLHRMGRLLVEEEDGDEVRVVQISEQTGQFFVGIAKSSKLYQYFVYCVFSILYIIYSYFFLQNRTSGTRASIKYAAINHPFSSFWWAIQSQPQLPPARDARYRS